MRESKRLTFAGEARLWFTTRLVLTKFGMGRRRDSMDFHSRTVAYVVSQTGKVQDESLQSRKVGFAVGPRCLRGGRRNVSPFSTLADVSKSGSLLGSKRRPSNDIRAHQRFTSFPSAIYRRCIEQFRRREQSRRIRSLCSREDGNEKRSVQDFDDSSAGSAGAGSGLCPEDFRNRQHSLQLHARRC